MRTTIFTPTECYSCPAIWRPESLRESCVVCLFWHQRTKAPLTRSDSGNSDDNYVPMNPGSSPLSAAQADSPKNIYIPMSPGPHHFDFPGFSATLPVRKGSSASLCHRPSRLSDVTPPPINRNLKPNRKCEFWQQRSHWSKVLVAIFGIKSLALKSALLIVFTKMVIFVDCICSCFPQRSQHLLIWRTMGSLMSCHLRAQSPCPGHGPCESHINHSS